MCAFLVRLAGGAIATVLGVSCTDYAPASDRLPESQDLAALPGSEGSNWDCLSTPVPVRTRAPGTLGAPIVYSLQLVDLATQVVLSNVTVRACGLTDIGCDNPVTAQLTPGPDGWVNVPLTENFQGYLEISSTGEVPYLFPLGDAGLRTMRDFPLVMISVESYVKLLDSARLTVDPTVGAIAALAFDCRGVPAPSVVMESSTGGLPYYFASGLPTLQGTQTDGDGIGGFLGSPPGVTLFGASLPDGTSIASRSVFVRASWMTVVYLRQAGATSAGN